MISKIKNGIYFIISISLLIILLSLNVSANDSAGEAIKVGSFEGSYNMVNEKGERSGYGYEYLQDIAGYTGWSYEHINSNWEECFNELEKGNIDILGGISYTKERAEKMLFSSMPMGEERYYIYTNNSNTGLSAADLSTFKDKNIGVLMDYIPEKVLDEWEKENSVFMNHVNISSTEEILDKMEKKEIDCFVTVEDSIWADYSMSLVTNIGESNIYFAIRKDRPDIKASLDNAMRRIKDDNPFYTDDLYKRYLLTQSSTFLFKDEKDWIEKHGPIRIGYLNNDTGVSVMNSETGELRGVITDYVELAKNSLQGQKLDFELKGYDTRNEQLKALHDDEIDLIFHVSQNPYSAEQNGFVLSDTVWSFNLAAITVKDSFDESANNTVAISKDNFSLKAYIRYNYPQWTMVECDDKEAAFKAMKSGKADCVMCNSGMVSDVIRNQDLYSFFLTKPADTSFAIRRGEPILVSIMNKTLKPISKEKLSGAVVSYSNALKKVSIEDFIRDNVTIVLVIVMFIFAVVCSLWQRTIHNVHEVKKLNEELTEQTETLEKALNAANLQSEIIGSISKIYSFIYRINLEDGTFEEVSSFESIKDMAGVKGLFSDAKHDVINALVSEEYRQIIEDFTDLSLIPDRLRDIDNISIEYRTTLNTWQMAQFIVKKRDENGTVTDVLYAGRKIDKQKELENQYKQELLFSSRVLSGLSGDYTIAFVLNLDTDEYEIAFNKNTNNAQKNDSIKTFSEYVDNFVNNFALPQFKDSMYEVLNSENIRKRFAAEEDFHYYFETIPNAAGLSCFQAHVVREYDEGGHFAFLGFRSVDDAVSQERSYKQMLQNQLNLITASLPGGVKISNDDPTYSFKYVSEQFASMLGYDSSDDLISACGGSIAGLAHPDDLNTGIADALDQYIRADHYATTYRMKCKDGSYKYIEDRGQKVIANDGTVEHWNLIMDNNDLMEKTIALESEKKANQSKTNFLARMSHDMRTPLNGIVGLMKINLDHFDDIPLVRENYKKMQASAKHLLSLINDVLQMSKIEDGTVPLTHELIDFNALTKDIVMMVEQQAKDKGLELTFKSRKKELEYPYVYGSPLHIRQIFVNIYSNCIKYNHTDGAISTISNYSVEKDGIITYEWIISDTGIGMSEEFLKHIFEPFVQEKDDARSVYQGTGLGMAIVKGLIDKMGGTINIESEVGVGSTFTIRIPLEIAYDVVPESEKEKTDDNDIRGLRLLLAEDNELNAEIAQMLLEDEGAEITIMDNGEKAVKAFEESAPGTFDAILMDIMMPVMNGYEATRAIRKLDREDAKTIPIIAMTANAFAEDVVKCLDAGMNAHLSKPLEMEKVKRTICEHVKRG